MSTHKSNGHKQRHHSNGHHSRRHQSSDQMNKRRLSKQEEIDLTLESIDLKDEAIDCNNKCNNYINNEPTIAPIIHVNSAEDRCDNKLMDKELDEKSEPLNNTNEKCTQSMHKTNSDSGQSLGAKLNVNHSNSLSTEDIKEKKRGKHLTRAEAVRDTSASPPPTTQTSDSDEKSSNSLSVISTNSQSQIGSSLNSQSHKNRVKAEGSSSGSLDRSSPCLSRDSSTENYSDLTGTDVQQFLMETLQKNKKDRVFLLKIEQDLNVLVKDSQKLSRIFPQMTSYNRMLVHRVAALFGFEHNVDLSGTSVVVTKSKTTRIPDMKFKDCIKEDLLHEPKKSILKRDSASLEDGSNGSQVSFDGKEKSPDRQTGNLTDGTRSKSFEEREEQYVKVRARIFNQDSSSSTEGNDSNGGQVMANNNSSNNGVNHVLTKNSSLRSSHSSEELTSKVNNCSTNEVREWSGSDSDSSGLQKNESKPKPIQPTEPLKSANTCDSDTTATPMVLPPPSGEEISLLAPEVTSFDTNNTQPKSRPTIAKASSFGGISRNIENSNKNSTQTTHLSKPGYYKCTQNTTQPHSAVNAVNSNPNHNSNTNRAITPKNNSKQENAHKIQTMGAIQHSEHRYVSPQPSHQPSASHHNRHHWHQNQQTRNNNRMTSIGNAVHWPQIVNQNFPHLLVQQNDSNQMKENQYLQQSGQQLFLSSVPNYGQTIHTEPQQHLTQPPIRLIYSNPSPPQMQTNVNSYGMNSVPHQSVPNQMPFSLQSTPSALNFSTNHSNLPQNLISASLSHSYGAPLQVPSNVGNMGTVWIINNAVNQQSNSPMMACPPPANTPPSASYGSNIAPFVGMSYQHYRPTINSNPNMSLSAAQNRAPTHLLKSQPILTTQANPQRIVSSNGNVLMGQHMPEMMDMSNMMGANGANNYLNRGPVVPQMRRMPVHQGLDVRLVGSSPHTSPPFLLPTPQRPYLTNTMNTVGVNRYANNANNVSQRSKNYFSKPKSQRYSSNSKNLLVTTHTSTDYSNT